MRKESQKLFEKGIEIAKSALKVDLSRDRISMGFNMDSVDRTDPQHFCNEIVLYQHAIKDTAFTAEIEAKSAGQEVFIVRNK